MDGTKIQFTFREILKRLARCILGVSYFTINTIIKNEARINHLVLSLVS